MRVGIFLPKAFRPYSVDFDGYVKQILLAGHEPVVVCRANEAGEAGCSVVVAGEEEERTPEFWKSLKLDLCICYTWLRLPETLLAMRAAGTFVLSRADSDGQFSYRVHPAATYRTLVSIARGPSDYLRRLRHFLRCYFFFYREFDRESLAVIAESDAFVIETVGARENLAKFFRHYHCGHLLDRVRVVAHSVPDGFLAGPVGRKERPLIYCAGRWDDRLKDAPLLCRAISRILSQEPQAEFLMTGSCVEEAFRGLTGFPQVRLLGRLPRESLPALLAECQVHLSSSISESQPIGALEALCCGTTVVGKPITGFEDVVDRGRFGAVSSGHSAASLATAALDELRRWKNGGRDQSAIAAHWRERVGNKMEIRKLLEIYADKSCR
ncbi:MAG: glycosyltransferase family 4 protein [Verrucomicrobiota bacterium]